MKNYVKTKILILLTFCLVTVSTQPLSEKTAKYGAIAGGVAAGTLTGLFTHYGFLKNSNINPTMKLLLTCLPAAGVGGLVWWLLDDYLFSLTPRGKCLAAEKIMRWIEMDSVIFKDFYSAEEFISHVTVRFGTSWPLVLSRNHLMLISTNLSQVQSLTQSIRSETSGNAEYADVLTRCQAMEAKFQSIATKIEQTINYLAKNPDYAFQVQLHEKHLEAERKRAHEQSLKQQDHSHDSWERSKDRWEKDKDRQLKKELVQGNNRPVMVSI